MGVGFEILLISLRLHGLLDYGINMDPTSGVHPASSSLTCGMWNIICEEHCRRRVQLGFNLAPSSSADFGRIYRAYSSSSLSLSVAAWDPGMFGMVWAPSTVLLGICRIINNFRELIGYWPTRIIVVHLIKRIFMEFLMELHGLFLALELYTIVHHHSQLLTIMNHHQPSWSLTFIHIHEHSLSIDIHHHFITFRPPLRVTHPTRSTPRCFPRASRVPPPAPCGARASARLWRWDGAACWGHRPPDGSLAFTFNDLLGKNREKHKRLEETWGNHFAAFYLQIYRSVHKLYNIFDHWVELVRKIFTAIPWSLPPKGSCRFSLQFWECILHRIIDFEASTGKCVGCFVYVEIWVFRLICWQWDGGLMLIQLYFIAMIFHQKRSLNPDRRGELNWSIHAQSKVT